VIVRDVLPAGLTFVDDTASACSAAGQAVTCALGALTAGASRELGVDVRVDPSLAGQNGAQQRKRRVRARRPHARSAEVVPSSNFDAADLVVAPIEVASPTAPVLPASAPPPQISTQCQSQRRFTIRLRERHAGEVRSALVRVNGHRVAVLRRRSDRRLVAVVDLRGRPQGTYKVELTARLRNGRQARWVRSYRTCTGDLPPSNRLLDPHALLARGPKAVGKTATRPTARRDDRSSGRTRSAAKSPRLTRGGFSRATARFCSTNGSGSRRSGTRSGAPSTMAFRGVRSF